MSVRVLLPRIAVGLLLAPALLLTATRLLEPEGARWVQFVAFTPLALVPYAVCAVLLVVAGLIRRRPGAAAVAVVAALGVAVHAWWFAPMLTGEEPTAAADADTLTVMTANMFFGDADGRALVRAAAAEGVDVLVVQEVTVTLLEEMEESGLGEEFAHRAGSPGPSARGTMVFADVPLGEPTRVATAWDSWLVDAGAVSLLAVHPSSPLHVETWRADHRLLLETVRAERPDLVVGDLNATLDHRPMRALADAGWRSVTEQANEGWQPTWSLSGLLGDASLPVPALVQIDHVLTGPAVAGLGSHTVRIAGSDHRALVAEVALP